MNQKARFFLRVLSPPGGRMAEALLVSEKKFGKYDVFSPAVLHAERECRFVSFPSLISIFDIEKKAEGVRKYFSHLSGESVSVLPGYLTADQVITTGVSADSYAIRISKTNLLKLQLVFEKNGYNVMPGTEPEFIHLLSLTFFTGLRRKLISDIY